MGEVGDVRGFVVECVVLFVEPGVARRAVLVGAAEEPQEVGGVEIVVLVWPFVDLHRVFGAALAPGGTFDDLVVDLDAQILLPLGLDELDLRVARAVSDGQLELLAAGVLALGIAGFGQKRLRHFQVKGLDRLQLFVVPREAGA